MSDLTTIAVVLTNDREVRAALEAFLVGLDCIMLTCTTAAAAINRCMAIDPALVIYHDPDSRYTQFARLLRHARSGDPPPTFQFVSSPQADRDGQATRVPPELATAIETCLSTRRGIRESGTYTVGGTSPFERLLKEAMSSVSSPRYGKALRARLTALRVAAENSRRRAAASAAGDILGSERSADDETIDHRTASGIRRSNRPYLSETRPSESQRVRVAHTPLVVLADDDIPLRKCLEEGLHAFGYKVLAANDGHTALGLCARHGPDAVVTAIDIPAIDGPQLIALLHHTVSVVPPVVILASDRDHAQIQGAASILYKPVEVERLVDAIDTAMVASAMLATARADASGNSYP